MPSVVVFFYLVWYYGLLTEFSPVLQTFSPRIS